MLKIAYLFRQTMAVNSLYPKKSKFNIVSGKLKGFLNRHRKPFIIAGLILLGVFLGLLALALAKYIGDNHIAMVESGNYYNQLRGLI